MKTWQRGFWAGTLANGPMTLALLLAARMNREMRALPPARLTGDLTRPLEKKLPAARRQDLTLVAHFGYAVCMGGAYAWCMNRLRPASVAAEAGWGTLFGLGVWLVSYPGWIEMFRLRPAASRLSRSQNAWMIAAHLVWGASLGFAEGELRRIGKSSLDGL